MPNRAATTTAAVIAVILPRFGRVGRAWTPVPTRSVPASCGVDTPFDELRAEFVRDAAYASAELRSAGRTRASAPTFDARGGTPVSPLSTLIARLESVSRFRRISSDFISEACW